MCKIPFYLIIFKYAVYIELNFMSQNTQYTKIQTSIFKEWNILRIF